MVSDDTEHTAAVARALILADGDVDRFRRALARDLRWWLLALPAGVGFATLRSILKLWFGISPLRSGVRSAGNGPAMRSALLGLACAHDDDLLRAFVRASTEITHTDPRAYFAALAVAIAAIGGDGPKGADRPNDYLARLASMMPGQEAAEMRELAARAVQSAGQGESVSAFARSIGSERGISGFCYHTVPCVLQVWFRFGDDLEHGLPAIIGAGGDTDTAGAILGAIVGARGGPESIPAGWLGGIVEWPRSVAWLERLAIELGRSLAGGEPGAAPAYFWPGVLPRNLVFLLIVLAHGVRRLLPPY